MPYFVLKGILRMTNPMAMIRGMRFLVVTYAKLMICVRCPRPILGSTIRRTVAPTTVSHDPLVQEILRLMGPCRRMFSSSLTEDVRLIADDIDHVIEKIDDLVLCQKIEHFAAAPFEIQEMYRKDAGEPPFISTCPSISLHLR